ncbi:MULTISPECIES: extracellular solute-binding protein [Halocynthiibacter]|uniref:Extracellular solute-binding protein n=1 Tax=Halocynthiibacter halioticoli TaxID=2986804 RepID=A0AAE3IY31_9RHOB|nr:MULTISPECIES: extracellular solute-binding protein [Halocynthiibacter]MCV6824377.1 extracellular solute-binding protein [Halocynthiibacter halioticoli]MCW4057378.1 extracellular solute-binding protein [Halocynthiibacter sp. SDUM655004]
MRLDLFQTAGRFMGAISLVFATGFANAEPKHGISMYGEPALPHDFVSLPYVNANAPKGGKIVLGEGGSFDSLNPHIAKSRVPWMLRFYAYESLMARSWDEPFTLYGLLAESVETSEERDWVQFTLRPEARFADGSPVTVEDVIWSYETLGTAGVGHPRYLGAWSKVEKAEAIDERTVRFTFKEPDRELALIMGMRPILKKAQWDGKEFNQGGFDIIPITTAPYQVGDFEPGKYVSLVRNPDYWGKDLPVNKGRANLDEIRMEFYLDGSVMFEAFKAGILTSFRETNAAKWEENYDFPAITSGKFVKSEIAHQRPTGITGFVMNTRRDQFKDWRVREALITLFNFEAINDTVSGGTLPRITSYFDNSPLGMKDGPAEGKVAELLEPYADDLLPGTIEGYTLPVSDGSLANRKNVRTALGLFKEAGWEIKDGKMQNAAGEPFQFEIVINAGDKSNERIGNLYVEALQPLGIDATLSRVDSAELKERTQIYDFDMAYYRRGLSLSPGNEQYNYWGSEGVEAPGSRNWMGMDVPAAEAMIDAMLNAPSQDDFVAAVRALDRILTSGRYVIPFSYSNIARIAHDSRLKYPEHVPIYGDWIMYQPDVWWMEE